MPDNQPSTPDSVARTPTGEIKDVGQTTSPAATTPQTSTTTETDTTTTESPKSILSGDGKSLANQAQEGKTSGAPESYSAFSVPEGFTLDESVVNEIGPKFKSMNLNQAQAQELVDFYIAHTKEAANAPFDLWRQTQEQWVKEVRNDPVLGPRIPQVTQSISRMIDTVAGGNTKIAQDFRQAMDFTGAGNHPGFIRMFYEISKLITEGAHVSGKGPSPAGQRAPGQMPSAAQAMYPNLPAGR